MEIRVATPKDAKELLGIYSYYVENTAISFEYVTPSVEEFEGRIKNTLAGFPYLVAIIDDRIVGYAYASAFHPRKAYEHWAEASIYIARDCHKQGIGRALYEELEKILVKQNVYAVIACVASPEVEDEYLTHNSELFHARMGYVQVGRFERCGLKFGRWYSMVYMQKMLAEREEEPQGLIAFCELQ